MKSPIFEIKEDEFEGFKEHYEILSQKYNDPWEISQGLKQYAEAYFDEGEYIGKGAYKVVYKFDDDTVLKIARPQDFKEMIQVYNSDYRHMVPDLIDGGKYWVLAERVLANGLPTYEQIFYNELNTIAKLFNNRSTHYVLKIIMREIASFEDLDEAAKSTSRTLAYSIQYFKGDIESTLSSIYRDKRADFIYNEYLSELFPALMKNMSTFAKNVIQMARDLAVPINDLHKNNLGITFDDARPVIIDI